MPQEPLFDRYVVDKGTVQAFEIRDLEAIWLFDDLRMPSGDSPVLERDLIGQLSADRDLFRSQAKDLAFQGT